MACLYMILREDILSEVRGKEMLTTGSMRWKTLSPASNGGLSAQVWK